MRAFIFGMIALAPACIDDHRTPGGTDAGSGSDNCAQVTHDVSIRSDGDAAGLPQSGCWDLYGKLTIEGKTIKDLKMLGDIRSVNDLEISDTMITDLGIPAAINVWYGEVKITSNSALTTLDNLTVQDGHLASVTITGNSALTSFDLGGLDNIDTDLTVSNNGALTGISFPTLQTVGGNITVGTNAATTLDFGQLTTAGSVSITGNAQLMSVTGLPSQTINGNFTLQGNTSLDNLAGMGSLQNVNGQFKVDGNTQLKSLSWIPSTSASIQGGVYVTNNPAITDVGGLSHFYYLGGITITGNTSLTYCAAHEVQACVSSYLGTPIINGNKSGSTTNCNSQSLTWCL